VFDDDRDLGVAVALDGRIVGAAHYGDLDGDAEIAVIVEDGWQRHGVGRVLMRDIADRAHADGYATATGCILRDNRAANRFLDATAPGARSVYDGPYRTFFVDLSLIPG
ncbi:MAG TPA: GNAT family N-acetyltransferase, partial [Actinomycetota bacterium]|nr:GNAT family N-acetyltransferase [Actinomycetota bacterium]